MRGGDELPVESHVGLTHCVSPVKWALVHDSARMKTGGFLGCHKTPGYFRVNVGMKVLCSPLGSLGMGMVRGERKLLLHVLLCSPATWTLGLKGLYQSACALKIFVRFKGEPTCVATLTA